MGRGTFCHVFCRAATLLWRRKATLRALVVHDSRSRGLNRLRARGRARAGALRQRSQRGRGGRRVPLASRALQAHLLALLRPEPPPPC